MKLRSLHIPFQENDGWYDMENNPFCNDCVAGSGQTFGGNILQQPIGCVGADLCVCPDGIVCPDGVPIYL